MDLEFDLDPQTGVGSCCSGGGNCVICKRTPALDCAIVLFDGLVGRSLDLPGNRDNLETVGEDGSWVVVHVELVLKQADIASKLDFACTVVVGENSHHALLLLPKDLTLALACGNT